MSRLALEPLAAACAAHLAATMDGDAAHDLAHVRRVVASAVRLAREERADLDVVVPAAWLHDGVTVPKDSPDRARASGLAARAAVAWLQARGFPEAKLDAVAHAIEAHSFSAGIAPRTPEARVVQDADRLDALGAIGIARCYATAGSMGSALVHPDDPVPAVDDDFQPLARELDDRRYATDHFFAKLFRLPATMQTEAGRREAERRVAFMQGFLAQLESETAPPEASGE